MRDISDLRHESCPRCGACFACDPLGECWCKAEPYRLPLAMVEKSEDGAAACVCPACLRKAAAESAF